MPRFDLIVINTLMLTALIQRDKAYRSEINCKWAAYLLSGPTRCCCRLAASPGLLHPLVFFWSNTVPRATRRSRAGCSDCRRSLSGCRRWNRDGPACWLQVSCVVAGELGKNTAERHVALEELFALSSTPLDKDWLYTHEIQNKRSPFNCGSTQILPWMPLIIPRSLFFSPLTPVRADCHHKLSPPKQHMQPCVYSLLQCFASGQTCGHRHRSQGAEQAPGWPAGAISSGGQSTQRLLFQSKSRSFRLTAGSEFMMNTWVTALEYWVLITLWDTRIHFLYQQCCIFLILH